MWLSAAVVAADDTSTADSDDACLTVWAADLVIDVILTDVVPLVDATLTALSFAEDTAGVGKIELYLTTDIGMVNGLPILMERSGSEDGLITFVRS